MALESGERLPIYLTRHARNRLRFWRLTEDDIRAVLDEPSYRTPSEHGRLNAWKETERGWIRVSFIDEGSRRVVITVTIRRVGPDHES